MACLETSPQLDPALHARIQETASALLPPQSVRQAEVLARIGEPLLDLLADRPPRTAREAVAVIRAASVIGDEAALGLIASAVKRDSRAVRQTAIQAWPLFDVGDFARIALVGHVR